VANAVLPQAVGPSIVRREDIGFEFLSLYVYKFVSFLVIAEMSF
jgi:hypothetical protein